MVKEQNQEIEDRYLSQIFQEILSIANGECNITDHTLIEAQDEKHFQVLAGLQMLHEDLNLYKKELRVKMEAEFQLKALKRRNDELSQFIFAVSHDLQAPLLTIQSFTNLLLKKNHEQLDANGQEFLKLINASSLRMSKLLLGLLEYSKAGKNIEFKPVDCSDLIGHVLNDLHFFIQKSAASISVYNLPVVLGDSIQLRQVFQNLISNSLKFKKESEPLEIIISIDYTPTHNVFCVQDNGIGIEKKHMDRIFGIFRRLHDDSEYEGTGIGLSLCKRIVEIHNGTIWVESEKNVGSKFFISLPKHQ